MHVYSVHLGGTNSIRIPTRFLMIACRNRDSQYGIACIARLFFSSRKRGFCTPNHCCRFYLPEISSRRTPAVRSSPSARIIRFVSCPFCAENLRLLEHCRRSSFLTVRRAVGHETVRSRCCRVTVEQNCSGPQRPF
jgi:hypothetical protein